MLKMGQFKIFRDCSQPLAAGAIVEELSTKLDWFHIAPEGMVVKEILKEITKVDFEPRAGCPARMVAEFRTITASDAGVQAQPSILPEVGSFACPD